MFGNRCRHQGTSLLLPQQCHRACQPVEASRGSGHAGLARLHRNREWLVLDPEIGWIGQWGVGLSTQPLVGVDQAAAATHQEWLQVVGE